MKIKTDKSLIQHIQQRVSTLRSDSAEQLRQKGLALKYDASVGRKLESLIPTAFSLVIEASRRTLEMTPYDVQIYGAIQIAHGHLAEMKTGEGKTLTATMPLYLHALSGRGAHLATVNDYLAQRDMDLMGPIFRQLGLSVGLIQTDMQPADRQLAYRKDITYGTAKEFGFDFLKDRLKNLNSGKANQNSDNVQRELNFVLVDEADSILIDEARTPLIIGIVDSREAQIQQDCFRWAANHAEQFIEGTDFEFDHELRKTELLRAGHQKIRGLGQTISTRLVSMREMNRYIENAIKVRRDFQLDKNYVIRDGKIEIVDEFTGRVAEGRKWQEGIHQSVEAKEKVEITPATQHGATVTLQSFFQRYRKFAGMTGTAWTSRAEFKKVYRKKVVRIPTNQPIDRRPLPTKVFLDFKSKMQAIANEVVEMIEAGRAVLVGTRSIEQSESLARLLTDRRINHQVLNANNLSREAEIIAGSGRAGCVTVATNMAGRGTDFLLSDEVRSAGGLHVILSELHESQRIDWQLIGRGCRQGDPGSFRIFTALDDELLETGLGSEAVSRLVAKYQAISDQTISDQTISGTTTSKPLPIDAFRHFQTAQMKIEKKHMVDRTVLRRQDKEKHERQFAMGLDPYCEVVR